MTIDDAGPSGSNRAADGAVAQPGPNDAGTTQAADSVNGGTAIATGGLESAEPRQLRPALEVIGAVLGQTTLMTALLYYFGYLYTDNKLQALGLDANILHYSTPDYVLRSFSSGIPSSGFLFVVALGLVAMGIYAKVRRLVDSGHRLEPVDRVAGAMVVAGRVLVVLGLLAISGVFDSLAHDQVGNLLKSNKIALPLSVLVGIVSSAYGTQIRRILVSSGPEREAARREPVWFRSLRLALVLAMAGVSIFWAAGEWATSSGADAAGELTDTLSSQPETVIHSKLDLGIDPSSGVHVEQAADAPDGYVYRYAGLRYLTQSGGKYFLLSPCWAADKGRTVVLTDDANVWVEVIPTPTAPQSCGWGILPAGARTDR